MLHEHEDAMAYASLSMAIGAIYLWVYAYNVVRISVEASLKIVKKNESSVGKFSIESSIAKPIRFSEPLLYREDTITSKENADALPLTRFEENTQWVLSPKYFNFPFPITLTMIHMGFSGAVAFFLIRVFKVVSLLKMTFEIYVTCVIPISAFFASSLCIEVVVSSYGEIHFNVIGTAYQVTGIFAEALRLVLTQVLLQKKGLTLNPITSLYYIAPCSFAFLFVPWYFLEQPGMEVSQIKFNFWIFFSNAICALALNLSIFLVIGRTGAVTIRVAGVLKDWILIALSTVIFPESIITGLNITGYAIALCGVVFYNYIKVKDVRSSQLPVESIPEGITKEWKFEKRSSDMFTPDRNNDERNSRGVGSASDLNVDEEAPLISSSRISHIGRSQLSNRDV